MYWELLKEQGALETSSSNELSNSYGDVCTNEILDGLESLANNPNQIGTTLAKKIYNATDAYRNVISEKFLYPITENDVEWLDRRFKEFLTYRLTAYDEFKGMTDLERIRKAMVSVGWKYHNCLGPEIEQWEILKALEELYKSAKAIIFKNTPEITTESGGWSVYINVPNQVLDIRFNLI